jgi:hypothetical protein
MRIAGLLALAFILPAFSYAADPPTLTTYTISHDTIYPTAATASSLATTTAIDVAFSEQVKVSIKILSASGGNVKSLYSSSSVTNPAPKIWDGTTTSGAPVSPGIYTILISATSTASDVLSMTDSSKTITVASAGEPTPPADSSDTGGTTIHTAPESSPAGGPPEYIPVPALRIITIGARTVSSGADTTFTAAVYDGKGNKRDDALVTWSFGDGMRRTGASVFHKYYEPGEYLAIVHAVTSDGGDARSDIRITVQNAGIKIASISPRGVSLSNTGTRTLDLSLWRLSAGGKEFKIPEDTQILPGHTVLFPVQIIELPLEYSGSLLYPSGEVAATYPAAMPAATVAYNGQPFAPSASSNTVQKVGSISSTKEETHADAVLAPAAAVEPAAAGAPSSASGIFRSPWTLGLLGIIAVAGGAFILL